MLSLVFVGGLVSSANGVDMKWGSGKVYKPSPYDATTLGTESTNSLYVINQASFDAIDAAVDGMAVGDAEEYIFNAYKNLTPDSSKVFDSNGKSSITVKNAGASGDTVYAVSIIRTTCDGTEYYRANYVAYTIPEGTSAEISWMGQRLKVYEGGSNLEWLEVTVQPEPRVPRTFTWTGAAGEDSGWTDGGNWDQDGDVPGEGDSVVISNAMKVAVSSSDQAILDVIADITLQDEASDGSPASLYVPGGDVAEIKCPITFGRGIAHSRLGREGSGVMIIKSLVDYSIGGDLELFGEVVFESGSSVKPKAKSRLLSLNGGNAVVRFAGGLLSAQSYYPVFRLRGDTTIGFDSMNALTQYGAAFVFGTSSTWGGCLDLNGYDQTISSISMYPATLGGSYLATTCLKSSTPATLTITKGTIVNGSAQAVLWAPVNGALSIRLEAGSGDVLSMTNVAGYASTTTGRVVSASGTVKLENGTSFVRLGQLVKTGTGNFEIGDVSLGDYVELSMEGEGKVTLNSDCTVKRAKVWNPKKSAYAYLEPKTYSASELPDHLAGTGHLIVRKGTPSSLIPLITNSNWIAESAASYAGATRKTGTWTGSASVEDEAIAFNTTPSAPLSFAPYSLPSRKTIREIVLDMSFAAPAQDADLRAALDDGAKYGVAVVAIDEELRYVTLLNGSWVTNTFHSAVLDGSEKVVYRIDGIEDEIVYKARSSGGAETELASASLETATFSRAKFIGEGAIKAMNGTCYRSALGPGLLITWR